jgi:hypothetical protein
MRLVKSAATIESALMRLVLRRLFAFALVSVSACGGQTTPPPDAFVPRDAAVTPDASVTPDAPFTPDAFVTPDAFSEADAFVAPDAVVPDVSILVIGTLDSGPASSFSSLLATWGTVTPTADPTLTSTFLAPFDLIVVGRLARAQTISEKASLVAWVASGHPLLVLGGYTGDAAERANIQSLISGFNMTVDPTRAVVVEVPTYAPDAVSRGTLTTAPMVNGGEVLTTPLGAGVSAEALATGAAPVAAHWDAPSGGGRVFVWLDEAVTLDPWDADRMTFWSNVHGYLTE